MPRDWAGTFTRRLVRKGQRRLDGLDAMIISLYTGGIEKCATFSTTWPPRSAWSCPWGPFRGPADAVADAVARVAARVRWRSPLPGDLPRARSGPMVRACSPGRLPLGPYRGRGGAWTGSSTWLKDLGPGPEEGASLKGGLCAPVPAQPQRRGLSDRRGGTSRTGAKRAGDATG